MGNNWSAKWAFDVKRTKRLEGSRPAAAHARQPKRFEEPLPGGRASPRAEKAFPKPTVHFRP